MDLCPQRDEAEQAELETLDEAYWDCPERLWVLGLIGSRYVAERFDHSMSISASSLSAASCNASTSSPLRLR